MKKLLVLLMVLGMAVSAQAGLELSVDGVTDGAENVTTISILTGTTVLIDVVGDTTDGWSVYLDLDPEATPGGMDDTTLGQWVAPVNIYAEAGADATVENIGYQAWSLNAQDFANPLTPGKAFDVVYECLGADVDGQGVIITLWASDYSTVLDQIIVHQIPEPLTIGLLGLGGLFLRRRK